MTSELHPEERAVLLRRIENRVDALHRVTHSKLVGSPAILGRFVWMVVWAALPLCGGVLRDEFLEWMGKNFREDIGHCRWCGRAKESVDDPMCGACEQEMRDLDNELKMEEADERRPQ